MYNFDFVRKIIDVAEQDKKIHNNYFEDKVEGVGTKIGRDCMRRFRKEFAKLKGGKIITICDEWGESYIRSTGDKTGVYKMALGIYDTILSDITSCLEDDKVEVFHDVSWKGEKKTRISVVIPYIDENIPYINEDKFNQNYLRYFTIKAGKEKQRKINKDLEVNMRAFLEGHDIPDLTVEKVEKWCNILNAGNSDVKVSTLLALNRYDTYKQRCYVYMLFKHVKFITGIDLFP